MYHRLRPACPAIGTFPFEALARHTGIVRAPNMLAPEQPVGGDADVAENVSLGRRTALRIVVVYLLVGAAWVLFSDRILATIVSDRATRDPLATVKGAFLLLRTAPLSYGSSSGGGPTLPEGTQDGGPG